ncbi:MAG: 30S ribosome-binding factor RbfA [Clostridiales Family XIII bacterium]|jgi:ribosome-binding factor A|nr:30S ribosome-binding factor RbfA [Clostridiales Family XIII bacterium]
MKKSYRQDRMGGEIRRIISELLLRELKDPRLSGLVSISDVEVAPDGSHATVYIIVPGEGGGPAAADKKKDVIDAFNRAKGLLRREIGARMQIRHTPELAFKIDTSEEYGRHIEEIFSSIGVGRPESGNAGEEDTEGEGYSGSVAE